jgi:hypothetical protein
LPVSSIWAGDSVNTFSDRFIDPLNWIFYVAALAKILSGGIGVTTGCAVIVTHTTNGVVDSGLTVLSGHGVTISLGGINILSFIYASIVLLMSTETNGGALGTFVWSSKAHDALTGTVSTGVIFDSPVFSSVTRCLGVTDFGRVVEPEVVGITSTALSGFVGGILTVLTAIDAASFTMVIGQVVSVITF